MGTNRREQSAATESSEVERTVVEAARVGAAVSDALPTNEADEAVVGRLMAQRVATLEEHPLRRSLPEVERTNKP